MLSHAPYNTAAMEKSGQGVVRWIGLSSCRFGKSSRKY